MKSIFCISLCGALLFLAGSCKNEFEAVQPQDGSSQTIGVTAHHSKQVYSRAGVISKDSLEAEIGVFRFWGYEASQSAAYISLIGGVNVTWNTTKTHWEYGSNPNDASTQATWPEVQSNFIAYAGATNVTEPTVGTRISTLSYTVPAAAAAQEDLLVAAVTGITRSNFGGKVPLTFQHALSAIAVTARTADAGQEVDVTGISLLNLQQTGDLDMTTLVATTPGTWTNLSNPSTGELTLFAGSTTATPATAKHVDSNTTPVNIVPANNPYIVLPQPTTLATALKYDAQAADITAAEATGNFYLVVRWSFVEADGTTATRTSLCAVATAPNSTTPITFEPNKRYTLNLILDAYSRQVVFNAPTVEEWDAAAELDVDPLGVELNKVIWSHYNLNAPGAFVNTITDLGMGYQFGVKVGWGQAVNTTGIDATGQTVATSAWYTTVGGTGGLPTTNWPAALDPCPDGWQLPTQAQWTALATAATGKISSVTVNSVAGTRVILPNGTLFFPGLTAARNSVGYATNITPSNASLYWCATGGNPAVRIYINPSTSGGGPNITVGQGSQTSDPNTRAYSIRCVKVL